MSRSGRWVLRYELSDLGVIATARLRPLFFTLERLFPERYGVSGAAAAYCTKLQQSYWAGMGLKHETCAFGSSLSRQTNLTFKNTIQNSEIFLYSGLGTSATTFYLMPNICIVVSVYPYGCLTQNQKKIYRVSKQKCNNVLQNQNFELRLIFLV